MSRQKILETAKSQSGVKESPAGSNQTKYGAWYGLNGEKWCAIFVSWVYNEAGYPLGRIDTSKGYQSCASGYNFWKKKNMLTSSPLGGDIVLYDWNGDGLCEHTGIFIEWINEGNSFFAWEGNTAVGDNSDGGQVMRRERKKSTVKAFVNPGVVDTQLSPVKEVLKMGDIGASITTLQKKLYNLGYVLMVDGDFGKETDRVVRQFQKDKGLESDGEVTSSLMSLLDEELASTKVSSRKVITGSFLKRGDAGSVVIALQNALQKKNAAFPITIDGVFGAETVKGLKIFQKSQNLKIDGIAGPETLKALGINRI